jgi:hypothetical protein
MYICNVYFFSSQNTLFFPHVPSCDIHRESPFYIYLSLLSSSSEQAYITYMT